TKPTNYLFGVIYLNSYTSRKTIRGRHGGISSLQYSRASYILSPSCQAVLRGCKSRLFDYLPFVNSSEKLAKKGVLGSTQNSGRILEDRYSLLEGLSLYAHFGEGKTLVDIVCIPFFLSILSSLLLFTFQEVTA
ncbi:MAG: hypothetical protein ACTSQE_17280, partial [Candidatus Heimdallarchaeaceae archaeon]